MEKQSGRELFARYHRPIFIAVLFLALFTLARVAKAETFELNKLIHEQSIVCFNRQAAVDIADAGKGGDVVVSQHLSLGNCFIIEGMFVYRRKVHQNGPFRVYEGTVAGKVPVWNPTDWVARGEADL